MPPPHVIALGAPCPDCGADPGAAHAKGCLTYAVERGDLTPRQRQVRLHEAGERARASGRLIHDAIANIHDEISRVGNGGGRIERIVMGTRAFKRLITTVPRDGNLDLVAPSSLTGMKYMGYDIAVDAALPPDAVYAIGKPDPFGVGPSLLGPSLHVDWSFGDGRQGNGTINPWSQPRWADPTLT